MVMKCAIYVENQDLGTNMIPISFGIESIFMFKVINGITR